MARKLQDAGKQESFINHFRKLHGTPEHIGCPTCLPFVEAKPADPQDPNAADRATCPRGGLGGPFPGGQLRRQVCSAVPEPGLVKGLHFLTGQVPHIKKSKQVKITHESYYCQGKITTNGMNGNDRPSAFTQ